MSPEQAWGRRDQVGPASDVYALGAVLYNILAGVAPYHGEHETAIRLVRLRPPRSVHDVIKKPAPPIPSGLTVICEKALSREPEDRYATAADLAAALSAWLAEDTRREEALELVRRAEGLLDEAKRLDAAASALESAYKLQSTFIPSDAPVEVKAVTWELERRARADRLALTRLRAEVEEHLWSALALVPDLPRGRTLMAQLQRDVLVEAEDRGDARDALERETWLRQVDDGAHAEFLQGDGRLTLHTEPAGATVILHRWVSEDRVLTPRVLRRLGKTPLDGVKLPRGSWLLTVNAPGCAEVRLPVSIGRQEHWDRVPSDGDGTAVLPLPAERDLAEGEVYVPGDWCIVGGGDGPDARPRSRVWCDGFLMQRLPITYGEWRDYLVDLVRRGEIDEARARARPSGYLETPLEPQPEIGVWADLTDAQAALPAHHVSRSDAEGYTAWRAARDGLPWRLPTEIEWEHAARGADGRAYPMGPNCDPALAHLWGCREGPGRAMPISDFPTDISPYGVVGLTGGVCDLTATGWGDGDSGSLVAKGGNALDFAEIATAWSRRRVPARRRVMLVGLRLVRDWPGAHP